MERSEGASRLESFVASTNPWRLQHRRGPAPQLAAERQARNGPFSTCSLADLSASIGVMALTEAELVSEVETYFGDVRRIRASGGATPERSYYPPLINLLNAIGKRLKPKVFSVSEMAEQGAGHPDVGLYVDRQLQRGTPRAGQLPDAGVLEVKPVTDDAWVVGGSRQVSRYWERYRLVLVTNTRDFVLLGEDSQGEPVRLETFRAANSLEDFLEGLERPRAFARAVADGLVGFLQRALSQRATLVEPEDLAWLLAAHAREGLARVEAADDTSSLQLIRGSLEDALGLHFDDASGKALFRSTLVQTLFYGVFSAWVLWAQQNPSKTGRFNWHEAVWHLRVPVLRGLFQQLSDPGRLKPLGLDEVLDWTSAALDRVDREVFFSRFSEGEAVPYFYEPFLEAFDPQLRKQLGVWYTPTEVVRYMVARVDMALKNDLGISNGLAADNVYVLDPCCGTGAYLSEVLRRIAENLRDSGVGALQGALVKNAATQRVFGFEIMPAPFVVAHLQVGLTLKDLDVSLSEDLDERPGVFLTNALTGWEPRPDQREIPFAELRDERDRAADVKQNTPVLVILGNPPYNGFAGVAVDEESELIDAYRMSGRDDRGLNDLYVRFFRMAERRIVDKTGKGIVCFISNYSWLDGLSFEQMRKRYLDIFDVIRVDNLHGDRIISEYAPDGRTSETVFAVRGKSPGIRVGTAITLLSRRGEASDEQRILYRDFDQAKAEERRSALLESLDAPGIDTDYRPVRLRAEIGLPFKHIDISDEWHQWPALPDLFEKSFPGIHTGRDRFLVDIDKDSLAERVGAYFDSAVTDDEMAKRYPAAMRNSTAFKISDARKARSEKLAEGGLQEGAFREIVYRPFDHRWLYWENDRRLLTAPSPDYEPHLFEGNLWMSAAQHIRKGVDEPQACFARNAGSFHLIERGASMFPAWVHDRGQRRMGDSDEGRRPNLTTKAERYLTNAGLGVADLFFHALATLHNPAYLQANSGGLRMGWPRIPLPGWPEGTQQGAAQQVRQSAAAGRSLMELLDIQTDVEGVTSGTVRAELAAVAIPATTDGQNMDGDDFKVSAGWGYFGRDAAVMPSTGQIAERPIDDAERAQRVEAIGDLGEITFDIYLNDRAFWRNVPEAVWGYKLGGYQVLKKWLSYRERTVLGRNLTSKEVEAFTNIARRIAAIVLLTGTIPN